MPNLSNGHGGARARMAAVGLAAVGLMAVVVTLGESHAVAQPQAGPQPQRPPVPALDPARLATAEQAQRLREMGLSGDEFASIRLGEYNPGPVRFTIWFPTRGHLLNGVNFMLRVTNLGPKTVHVEWLRSTDTSGWYDPEFLLTDSRIGTVTYPLVPEPFTLGANGEWSEVYTVPGTLQVTANSAIRLVYRLKAQLQSGMDTLNTALSQQDDAYLTLRPVTPDDVKSATDECAALAARANVQGARARLLFLLARSEKPFEGLSAEQVRTAFENLAMAPTIAEKVLERLIDLRSQDEMVAYMMSRLKAGDSSVLPRGAVYLPAEAETLMAGLLDSPVAVARQRALDALAARGVSSVPTARYVALLNDPVAAVKLAAMSALGRLHLPVADTLAPFLFDSDITIARQAVSSLALLDCKAQLPSIIRAMSAQSDAYLQAALIELAARNGASADLIRPFLKSKHPVPRAAAIFALGTLNSADDLPMILGFLESGMKSDVAAAAVAAGKLKAVRYVFAIGQFAISEDSVGSAVAESMVHLGTPEALAVLRELAVTRRVKGDQGNAQRDAVRGMVRLAADDAKVVELIKVLATREAHRAAKEEAVRQLGRLGKAGIAGLKAQLSDRELGPAAMWELSRITAPQTFTELAVRQPMRRPGLVRDWMAAIGRSTEWASDAAQLGASVPLDPVANFVSLRDPMMAIARTTGVGFILTDTSWRFVTRAEAAEYYRANVPD